MIEIPDEWWPVLNALFEGPVAWQSPAELAAALDRDVEETTDLLCVMDVAGWLDTWECDPEPQVTYSPLAAERLQVHLVEVGPDESPRWAHVGDPLPPSPKAKHVCVAEQAAALDYVIDPAPGPELAAERAEAAAQSVSTRDETRDRPTKAEALPFPTLLIGQGLTPWPGPDRDVRADCPACGGQGLRRHMYCLCCDRWGMDGLVATSPSKAGGPTQPRRPLLSPEEQARREQIQYERERESRKTRRLARHQAQVEADRLRKNNRRADGRASAKLVSETE